MTDTTGVTASGPLAFTSSAFDAGVSSMSAESLLAFCQMQLGDLDNQISDQMTAQRTAMHERQAVQSAESVLQQFGNDGPQNPGDMQKCVDAVNSAIAQLPTDDPVAGQLATFRDQMISTYNYNPGRPLTLDEQRQLEADQAALNALPGPSGTGSSDGATASTQSAGGDPGARVVAAHNVNPNAAADLQPFESAAQLQFEIKTLEAIPTPSFNKPAAGQWQGTTGALTNIEQDIKGTADIQLLSLQDLVSQRQQAIQLCSGMMSKTDQTLEDQAKAIGR